MENFNVDINRVIKDIQEELGDSWKLEDLLKVKAEDKIFPNAFLREKGYEPFILTNQTRTAATESDFEEIYNRESKARDIQNTAEAHQTFKIDLADHTKELIILYKKIRTFDGGARDYSLISLAERFIIYLRPSGKEATHVKTIESNSRNSTKEKIKKHFEKLDTNGWKYAFKEESSYKSFIDILTSFFEQKEMNLPDRAIELHKGCKTRLAPLFREIHDELKQGNLKSDYKYHDLIRILKPFKDLTNDQIYKDITR